MDAVRLSAAALVAALVLSVTKTFSPSFEIPSRLAVAALFLGAVLSLAAPLFTLFRDLCERPALAEVAGILSGALGVALLTGTAGEICRECREASLASYIELAGRVEILLLCLPLVREILGAVDALLSL